jgi:hypothetical protein
MKAFLRHIALFCLVFIPFYIIACTIWGELIPPNFSGNLKYKRGGHGHTQLRAQESYQVKNPDILLFGSSHCFRGFDPRLFAEQGITIFNWGSTSQTPTQTMMLMEKHLDRIQPKLVVLEIYPYLFQMDGIESMLDLLANDSIDQRSFVYTAEINKFKLYHTLGFSWYKQNLSPISSHSQPIISFGDEYISGGYNRKIKGHYHGPKTFKPTTWNPRKDQLAYFEKILLTLKSKNIPYILVQAPIIQEMYNARTDHFKIENYFSSKGVYWNYNGNTAFSDTTLFFDEHHLNESGVKLFNELFVADLLKSGMVKNDK